MKGKSSGFDKDGLPKNAKLMAASADGSLEVFAVDTSEELSLYFRKNGKLVTLFENPRE